MFPVFVNPPGWASRTTTSPSFLNPQRDALRFPISIAHHKKKAREAPSSPHILRMLCYRDKEVPSTPPSAPLSPPLLPALPSSSVKSKRRFFAIPTCLFSSPPPPPPSSSSSRTELVGLGWVGPGEKKGRGREGGKEGSGGERGKKTGEVFFFFLLPVLFFSFFLYYSRRREEEDEEAAQKEGINMEYVLLPQAL